MYSSSIGFHIAIIIVKIKNFYSYAMYLNDIDAIKRQFKRAHGYFLDIDHPKTLNEKMQWLKINDRTPKLTLYADKYAVRDFYEVQVWRRWTCSFGISHKRLEANYKRSYARISIYN